MGYISAIFYILFFFFCIILKYRFKRCMQENYPLKKMPLELNICIAILLLREKRMMFRRKRVQK